MLKITFTTSLLLVTVVANAQFKNKGFYGKDTGSIRPAGRAYADGEVTEMINNMCDKMGFENRYIIQANPGVANCEASVNEQGKPVIYYNEGFLKRVSGFNFTATTLPGATEQDWKTLAVLAHELGHHLNQHLTNLMPGMNEHDAELEADRFAGHMLHTLGATLQQAQAIMYSKDVPEKPSMTHPGRAERLKAIEVGWNKVKEIPKVAPPPDNVPPKPVTTALDLNEVTYEGELETGGDKISFYNHANGTVEFNGKVGIYTFNGKGRITKNSIAVTGEVRGTLSISADRKHLNGSLTYKTGASLRIAMKRN